MAVSEPGMPAEQQPYAQGGVYPQGGAAPATWQQTGKVGQPTSVGKQVVLYIVTLGIWGAVWIYRQHRDIKEYSGEGVGGGLGLVIALFVGIVTPFLLANEVQTKLYQRAGREAPVSAATGAWILLPLVGQLVWYLKVQKAINEFWFSLGAPQP